MSYCFNPNCPQPQNPEGMNFCQQCGSKLLLKERYRALKIIGQGGFGKTFFAFDADKPSHPPCVIKQFLSQRQGINQAQKAAKLFAQEALQLEKLGKHDQIPELFAYFQQSGQHYLVQEFVDGDNLSAELAQEGAFKETQIRQLLNSLLRVLQFVHSNQVIHRDIKPENIIRRRRDGQLVLVDFGAAKFATGMTVIKQGTVIGTPQYVAPEQAQGKALFASDLYSLGVTCLHLLTQVDPFDLLAETGNGWVWRDYVANPLGDNLGEILDKMVQKNGNKRYQSALEVLQDLNPGVVFPAIAPLNPQLNPATVKITKAKKKPPLVLQPVQVGDKFGYQDNHTGEVAIEAQFDSACEFKSGLARVKIGTHYGYINTTGQVISPLFLAARDFAEGLAAVKVSRKLLGIVPFGHQWGYIDSTGELAIPDQFDGAGDFSEGLGLVKIGSKYGYINPLGELVIPPQFAGARNFRVGLARVRIGKRYSYIDKTGRLVSQMFDWAGEFNQGLASVCVDDRYGYIDTTGKLVIPLHYEDARDFSEGLAAVKQEGKYGYIDTTTQMLIPPQFIEAQDFAEGLAAVKIPLQLMRVTIGFGLGAKWGYIDSTGEVVIQPQFQAVQGFAQGRAKVKCGNQEQYIDNTGKIVGR